MNTDKEQIYSKSVVSGIVIGMGMALIIAGTFYAFSQKQDAKIGAGISIIGIATFILGAFMAPPIEEIKYLKGK